MDQRYAVQQREDKHPALRGHILVVDDEISVCAVLVQVFRYEGFEANAVISAPDAFDYLSQHTVDLVVTDIHMQPMNGLTMAKIIKLEFPGPEIVFCTGYGSPKIKEIAHRIGVREFITKPFQIETMLRAVRRNIVFGPNLRDAYFQSLLEGKEEEFMGRNRDDEEGS